MKSKITILILALLVAGGLFWLKWRNDEPRRECVKALRNFEVALRSGDSARLVACIVMPQAIVNRTPAEQVQFLSKALQDEISPGGIRELAKRGRFGRLDQIFPDEAEHWASQAGAAVTNCVAFRMEQAGIRVEVVLLKEGGGFRVVRCNNVKQMEWIAGG